MNESLRQLALAAAYGLILVVIFFLSAGSKAVFIYQGF
jgi:hypothetical protein